MSNEDQMNQSKTELMFSGWNKDEVTMLHKIMSNIEKNSSKSLPTAFKELKGRVDVAHFGEESNVETIDELRDKYNQYAPGYAPVTDGRGNILE